MKPRFPALAFLLVLALPALCAYAFDWPQWRGPNRDDVSKETGLLKQWPEGGPKQLWLYKNGGQGYSGPAIVAGKLFTMGTREGSEILLCLDAGTGKELWATPAGQIFADSRGDGPRGTPTVEADRVYTLGGEGTLLCANVADGKEVWRRTMKELGGKTPGWGYTEGALVDGNQVVCTPGGSQGTIAALDKATGKTLWQTEDFTVGAQYSSIVAAEINGEKQYVQLTMNTLVGVSPKDGTVLWRTPFPGRTAVVPTPIVKDNHVFITAGYGVGCRLVKIEPGNKVTGVYDNKVMTNHHGGVILVGDHLYGYSEKVGWVCMEFKTGNQVWAEEGKLGKGAIAHADGMLYCLEERSGTVVLIEGSPTRWNEKGRFKPEPQSAIRSSKGQIWTHPVIVNGKLYLRDQDLIYCYAVK
ncbi:MAG: PQQ-like beta-propeller repeat protein [Verrucomicrobiota bacterium]|nr:PQQ-like beta-propeller repeat protein [Verrucomicrobiota bacterium]